MWTDLYISIYMEEEVHGKTPFLVGVIWVWLSSSPNGGITTCSRLLKWGMWEELELLLTNSHQNPQQVEHTLIRAASVLLL